MNTDVIINQEETGKAEENLQDDKTDMLQEKNQKENTYKIFDFFKERLGLLVTCASAVIAIMSIVLNFAVRHMNNAYVQYWNISSIHVNNNDENNIHLLACALLYFLSIMFVNGLISGTADTFGYYNKVLSRVGHTIKETNEKSNSLYKKLRKLRKKVKRLEQEDGVDAEDIKAGLTEHQNTLDRCKEHLKALRKARISVLFKVIIELIAVIAISYLTLGFALLLLNSSSTVEKLFQATVPALGVIAFDILVYFTPVYFKTQCTYKQFKEENSAEFVLKLIEDGVPNFPIEEFARKGIKSFLSDKSIKLGLAKIVFGAVLVLCIIVLAGTISASEQRSFPVYTDGTKTYAIVYFSGSTMFMEEATYQNGTITIDTTKQRIITTDDLTYDMLTFDEVIVRGMENIEEAEPSKSNISNKISSFFESLKLKFANGLNINEGFATEN